MIEKLIKCKKLAIALIITMLIGVLCGFMPSLPKLSHSTPNFAEGAGAIEMYAAVDQETDTAFNAMCQSVFGISYANFKSNSNYAEVYVGLNTGGEQTGDIGTEEKPYGSVNMVYSSLSSQGLIIHLLDSYSSVNEGLETWPDNPIPTVIISEAYDTAVLNMSSTKWNFSANTGFYNVKIKLTYSAGTVSTMFANGHNIVFGGEGKNNFAFVNEDTARYYPTLFGASEQSTGTEIKHSSVANTHLEIYGGMWSQIFGGGEHYSDVLGTATVIVNGSYYNESGALVEGAVTFASSGFGYMEASSHIYGGGSGALSLAKENYSKVENTDVKVSYITTDKFLTPCGGNVVTSAKIDVNYVTAKGVNARSEGSSAKAVTIVVNNSTIKKQIGSLGGNLGDSKKNTKIESDINDFNITVKNSSVYDGLYVKVNSLANGSYNNRVSGVDLILEDSTFSIITMAQLDAEYTSGTVELLRLKNVKCNRYSSGANFGKFKKIEMIGIGTESSPFIWENRTFSSAGYGGANALSESLMIENSYVNFRIDYKTKSLELKGNSQIKLEKERSTDNSVSKNLKFITDNLSASTSSSIILEDGVTAIVNGSLSGDGITVKPDFATEDATAQILWNRGSNPTNLSYVKSSVPEGPRFTKDRTARMDIWKWYNYDVPETQFKYVYVDGELGHDSIAEYGSTITDAILGFDKLYPVKTFEKAYSLCENENTIIVLCGVYNFDIGSEPKNLLGNAVAKNFQVRIQSTDDKNDYRNVAKVCFSGTTGNVNLTAPLIFDNINFETSIAEKTVRIFSNGYKTEYGRGVKVTRVGTNCHVAVYGGADGANVKSTDLTVRASLFDYIGAVGKDGYSSVGDESNTTNTDIVARLTVDENTSGISRIVYYGTAYGSVHTELHYKSGNKHIYLNGAGGGYGAKASVVYGDFYTKVLCDNGESKYAHVVPSGLTVKGTTTYIDQSGVTTYSGYFDMQNGEFNEVVIDLSVGYVAPARLFDSKTNAKSITWNISGNVPTVYGANDNQYISNGTMTVDVILNNSKTTSVKACSNENNNTVLSGYSEKDGIKLTFNDFQEGSYLDKLWGFGSVTFNNSKILVKSDVYTKNITIDNESAVVFTDDTIIGIAPNNGGLILQNNATLEVRNQFTIKGDMVGATSQTTAGMLIDNWPNADDETEMIVINGKTTGYTYFSTDYSSAKIKVMGDTEGSEYLAPVLPPERPQMTITCNPISGTTEKGRIWNIGNPISKKYIFVDGTLNPSTIPNYNEKHDGLTLQTAFATLKEAYDTVLTNGYIIICGDLTLSKWPENGTKPVTITSKVTVGTGDSSISYDYFSSTASKKCHFIMTSNLEIKGITTFEYLNIKADKVYILSACGNKIVMGREGDNNSIVMTDKAIRLGGGGFDNVYRNMNSDVTIYAGKYDVVSGGNSGDNYGKESTYSSVNITIEGGTFQHIYAKYNLYDHFPTNAYLSIKNAKVEEDITAIGVNYSVGTNYYINIGEKMQFGESCFIRTSTRQVNYGSDPNIYLTIYGDGYIIPKIYGGCGNGGSSSNEKVVVNLKNVNVGTYICGPTNSGLNNNTSATLELNLYDNVHISQIYFGGVIKTNKSVKVFVRSNSATIDAINTACVNTSALKPETCELTYAGVGTLENPYVLSENIRLDGFTKLTIQDSVVDFSNICDTITANEFTISSASIIYSGRHFTINGDYIAGTSENPAMFYGKNVPLIFINGTVSGITRLQSLSADLSTADGKVTGKFYNGISVTASKNESHSVNNFLSLFTSADGTLSWQTLNFEKGTDNDIWKKSDEGDTVDRKLVYVSNEGLDVNAGTFPSPVKTLSQAYKRAYELYQADNTKTQIEIILMDFIEYGDDTLPTDLSNGFSVVIKAYESGATLIVNADSDLLLPVDTTFDNIKIKSTANTGYAEIFANGNTLTCTNNLTCEAVSGHYPVIYGGTSDAGAILTNTNLVINGGTWNQIFGGSKFAHVDTVSLYVGNAVNTKDIGTTGEYETGVFGGGLNGTVGTVTLNVEGGLFYRVFGGGLNSSAVVQGDITVNFNYGTIDRLYGGGQNAQTEGNITVKIGTSKGDAIITAMFRGSGLYAGVSAGKIATTYVNEGATIQEGVQFAAGGYSGNLDNTELYIKGGEINCDIFAGGWGEGTPGTYGNVTKGTTIIISGGTINGNIYGGGNLGSVGTIETKDAITTVTINNGSMKGDIYGGGKVASTYGNIEVTLDMVNGSIVGSVFGGAEGSNEISANVDGKATVNVKNVKIEQSTTADFNAIYGGGNINGTVTNTIVNVTTLPSCAIFGGGKGELTTVNNSTIKLKYTKQDNDENSYNVYGGGNLGKTGTSNITIEGWVGNVFGGGRGEKVTEQTVSLTQGLLNIFQSAAYKANLPTILSSANELDGLKDANTGNTIITISGSITGNIYGGGELATVGNSTTLGNTVANITVKTGANVTGNIYGGGKGLEGQNFAVIYGSTSVIVEDGTVNGTMVNGEKVDSAIFGGGQIAPVKGNTNVSISGGTIYNVFGGNDESGNITGSINVTVSGGEIQGVYGGGRNAAYAGTETKVDISGGTITNVFGGGFGEKATTNKTNVTVSGGNITTLYGGGELAAVGNANVSNSTETKVYATNITIKNGANIVNVYGGGKGKKGKSFAAINGNTSIKVEGGTVCVIVDGKKVGGAIFGGGENAPVNGNTNVEIKGGTLNDVFGGNDESGDILGSTNVAVSSGKIENVYGGGRDAAYTGAGTNVDISAGTITNVFGGGLGITATTNKTKVTVSGGKIETLYGGGNAAETENANVIVSGGVITTLYGGGNAATVTQSTCVTVDTGANRCIETAFLGNNKAEMNIQPSIVLNSGEIGTLYCGGNEGAMTKEGLSFELYDADSTDEKIKIDTVYGGCNQADVTHGVELILTSGTYVTVYGGNNVSGEMPSTNVTLNGATVTNSLYGGGNQANVENTTVTLSSGTVDFVYGGCNEADVTTGVSLTLNGATVNSAVYAGCNTRGQVPTTMVTISGNVNAEIASSKKVKIFGGGRGASTTVEKSNIDITNGVINANIYGGSGYGVVGSSKIEINDGSPTAETKEVSSTDKIIINGNVFGAGYGESSHTEKTHIIVDMMLKISTDATTNPDLLVTEKITDTQTTEEAGSGQTAVTLAWNNENISKIEGNIYGGGDMGQVGEGAINNATNTASVQTKGTTQVDIKNGYIKGNIFGGGSGQPDTGLEYTAYMGTVFGSCQVDFMGGYVSNSIYGAGYQSRLYAPLNTKATTVNIWETLKGSDYSNSNDITTMPYSGKNTATTPVVVGESVFGGGAKGDGNTTNPTVYTVVGDTLVNIVGVSSGVEKTMPTEIYFDSSTKGGVYGDGNLCLVNGERTVNIRYFHCGYGDGTGNKVNKLKTFYSLQRADVVNITHSKMVLLGAKDLVDENARDTLYSINRVDQLNMSNNSIIKLSTIVNLLGGLKSDEMATTRFIDRGNNGSNSYTSRGGKGEKGTDKGNFGVNDGIRTLDEEIYRDQYEEYLKNGTVASNSTTGIKSFNEVCVANGGYLEIKKSDTEYGNVNGLFILSLLHSTPGEGGGFVYAAISDGDILDSGSTGAFVCITEDASSTATNKVYMTISQNVGGFRDIDYTYYYWFIKGNKYNYDMNVNGYIGTAETAFDTSASLMEMQVPYHYIFSSISSAKDVTPFCTSQFKDHWEDTYNTGDFYALELLMVCDGVDKSIGYLGYNENWYLKTGDTTQITGCGSDTADSSILAKNDIYTIPGDVRSLELKIVLHKGTGVLTEIHNFSIKMEFRVIKGKVETVTDPNTNTTTTKTVGYLTDDNASEITTNLLVSITRIVPSQDVYMSSGRLYSGVVNNSYAKITAKSAFTVQFITKFMPNAFNSTGNYMTESLSTRCDEIYLFDSNNGIGITVKENSASLSGTGYDVIYVSQGTIGEYIVSFDGTAYSYKLTSDETNTSRPLVQQASMYTSMNGTEKGIPKIPVGTVITMIAKIDSYATTYWYYYVTEETDTIELSKFKLMNTAFNDTNNGYTFEKASNGNVSYTSAQRITESLSFVFDFSQTSLSESVSGSTDLVGQLRLLHTYTNNGKAVDMMDFVSSKTEENPAGIRMFPKISEKFTIKQGTDAINSISMSVDKESGNSKDTYELTFTINEDSTLDNTRFDEREYSIDLKLKGDAKFPEGIVFLYGDKQLPVLGNNTIVSVPVKTAGEHKVIMKTEMEGFEAGKIELTATLHSSAQAGYYNANLSSKSATAMFNVTNNNTFALSVERLGGTETAEDHTVSQGETLELSVKTKSTITNDTETFSVSVFKYDRENNDYVLVNISDVFSEDVTQNEQSWNATVSEDAPLSTYRLEFRYHDKVVYWDFIVTT